MQKRLNVAFVVFVNVSPFLFCFFTSKKETNRDTSRKSYNIDHKFSTALVKFFLSFNSTSRLGSLYFIHFTVDYFPFIKHDAKD